MKIIDKLAWIEIKDNAILSTRSRGKVKFYFPGGKREVGETDHQALIREIKEELDIDLDEKSLIFFGVFLAQADGHSEETTVKMTCYTGNYIGKLKPMSEIEEIRWLKYSEKEYSSTVDQIIFEYLKVHGFLN